MPLNRTVLGHFRVSLRLRSKGNTKGVILKGDSNQ